MFKTFKMSKKNKFEKFNLMRQGIQESIQRIHLSVKKLQEQKEVEAGALIIATIPKTIIEKRPKDNLDFMIGATGNPEKVAEAMIRKAKKDIFFAQFCQTLLTNLSEKMISEGIEEKIEKAKVQADAFAKSHIAKMKEQQENKK